MKAEESPSALPTFTTERLRIRPLDRKDAEAVFAIQSDPRVREQYCSEPFKTIEETNRWLEDQMTNREKRESFFWVFTLKDDDRAIGSCCLWHLDWDSHLGELGYELHRDYWRKGITSEAIPPVLDYAFGELGFHRIEACPFSDNVASNKLLLRLGFKCEGNLRQRYLFRGRYFDQLWYGVLRDEWEARSR